MPWFIKLDEEQDLQVLKNFIDGRLIRFNDNISAYVELAIQYERIAKALTDARHADSVSLHVPEPATKINVATKMVELPKLCEAHPTYGAKRAPRTDCEMCWKLYEKYCGPSRYKSARAKFARKEARYIESD